MPVELNPSLWEVLDALNAIVDPMLSQFHAVFLGFYLSCEPKFIMQVKFSCVPGDTHMGSPSFIFFGIGDRDYIVLIGDVFHFMALKRRTRDKT
jgi:hypothetical protein